MAKLARLRLSDEEVHAFARQLSDVLEHVSGLQSLDLDGVEPMAHALDLVNVLRDDTPGPTLTNDDALRNAPQPDPPFFGVTKVLGEASGA